uniref:Transcription initiation factor TFIID subunit 13 n=1 Tax=Peronospora matthiolae TaxID=2874970 RepID=A0AAV1TLQ9_9STRA
MISSDSSKKKAAPKSRKRKTSDAGAGGRSLLGPGKRLLSDGDTSITGSDSCTDIQGAQAAQSKPLARGELVDSIKHMLFGFGDENEPRDETAQLMEELVVEYVHAMTKKAMDLAAVKGKLDTECFIFLIRKDPERYNRVAELLRANDEFRAALNSGFDPSDENMY